MKKPRKRVVIEWTLLVGTLLFINFTSYGTTVQGWFQQGLLRTGLFTPDLSIVESYDVPANYDVDLVRLDGSRTSLQEFKGKAIFINVWATWCPPCLAEMPFIQNLYEDFQDNPDIAFVMISADDTNEIARNFIEKNGYSFPVYRLTSRMPPPYTSNALPTTYVITPNGMLATVHAGMANYDSRSFRNFLLDLSSPASIGGP